LTTGKGRFHDCGQTRAKRLWKTESTVLPAPKTNRRLYGIWRYITIFLQYFGTARVEFGIFRLYFPRQPPEPPKRWHFGDFLTSFEAKPKPAKPGSLPPFLKEKAARWTRQYLPPIP
jgi:hypothetical protein